MPIDDALPDGSLKLGARIVRLIGRFGLHAKVPFLLRAAVTFFLELPQNVLIGVRNLLAHRRRTVLLGMAIGGVTMLLLLLLGLSNGMRETMLKSATTMMTGHVNVGGFFKVTAGVGNPVVTDFKKVREDVQAIVPELAYATERGRGWAKLVSDTGSTQVGIGGVDIDREVGFRDVIIVAEGSLDSLKKPGNVLIFADQAKRLEAKVGDLLTLSAPTMRGTNNTIDLTVGAIANDVGIMSKFNIFVPNQTLRALYQLNEDSTGVVHLYLKDIDSSVAVAERLREELPKKGYVLMDKDPRPFWEKFEVVNREDWTGQKLDITVWEDEISFVQWTLKAIDVLTFVLTIALMVVIGIGLMNTMAIAIRERTREIGTLRAVGMQRESVMALFLTEAIILGVVAAASGAALGLLIALGLNLANIHVPLSMQLFLMSEYLNLAIAPASIFGAVLFVTICITLISLIPSYLAARLKPVTAMHHIG